MSSGAKKTRGSARTVISNVHREATELEKVPVNDISIIQAESLLKRLLDRKAECLKYDQLILDSLDDDDEAQDAEVEAIDSYKEKAVVAEVF